MYISLIYVIGSMTNTRNLKEIHGKVNWDGVIRYEVKASLASEKSGPGMVYTPLLTIRSPSRSPVDFVGTIKYAPWKVFDSELTLKGMTATPIRIEGNIYEQIIILREITMNYRLSHEFDTIIVGKTLVIANLFGVLG